MFRSRRFPDMRQAEIEERARACVDLRRGESPTKTAAVQRRLAQGRELVVDRAKQLTFSPDPRRVECSSPVRPRNRTPVRCEEAVLPSTIQVDYKLLDSEEMIRLLQAEKQGKQDAEAQMVCLRRQVTAAEKVAARATKRQLEARDHVSQTERAPLEVCSMGPQELEGQIAELLQQLATAESRLVSEAGVKTQLESKANALAKQADAACQGNDALQKQLSMWQSQEDATRALLLEKFCDERDVFQSRLSEMEDRERSQARDEAMSRAETASLQEECVTLQREIESIKTTSIALDAPAVDSEQIALEKQAGAAGQEMEALQKQLSVALYREESTRMQLIETFRVERDVLESRISEMEGRERSQARLEAMSRSDAVSLQEECATLHTEILSIKAKTIVLDVRTAEPECQLKDSLDMEQRGGACATQEMSTVFDKQVPVLRQLVREHEADVTVLIDNLRCAANCPVDGGHVDSAWERSRLELELAEAACANRIALYEEQSEMALRSTLFQVAASQSEHQVLLTKYSVTEAAVAAFESRLETATRKQHDGFSEEREALKRRLDVAKRKLMISEAHTARLEQDCELRVAAQNEEAQLVDDQGPPQRTKPSVDETIALLEAERDQLLKVVGLEKRGRDDAEALAMVLKRQVASAERAAARASKKTSVSFAIPDAIE